MSGQQKRCWFQFSLRGLLVVVAVAGPLTLLGQYAYDAVKDLSPFNPWVQTSMVAGFVAVVIAGGALLTWLVTRKDKGD